MRTAVYVDGFNLYFGVLKDDQQAGEVVRLDRAPPTWSTMTAYGC